MTEFCKAVAYAVYCVGLDNTSFKTEEALIYV